MNSDLPAKIRAKVVIAQGEKPVNFLAFGKGEDYYCWVFTDDKLEDCIGNIHRMIFSPDLSLGVMDGHKIINRMIAMVTDG